MDDESIGAAASFSSYAESIEHSDDVSTSITNLPATELVHEEMHPHFPDRRTSLFDTVSPLTVTDHQVPQQFVTDDGSYSTVAVSLTFSFFVSMIMILGVYGSTHLMLGPNSSILIQPNPLFVKYIKVERLEEKAAKSNQPTLYGFHEIPALDNVSWESKTHKIGLPSSTHEEWAYFLNPGSQINVSYTILSSPPSSALILVIAQGNDGLSKWLEDPASPDSTLSWKIIKGTGMIQLDIFTSSSYFVAAGNLNAEVVEVELNVSVRASLYNTSKAYYECSLIHGNCSLDLSFAGKNIALLTTPDSPGLDSYGWYVKLSYGPRWQTYLLLICGMTVLMSTVFYVLNNSQCTRGNRVQVGGMESERTPLLTNKDEDLSSWGSLCDTGSQDEVLEGGRAIGSLEGSARDREYDDARPMCVICFDAPRDCFFLPCGHCAACFACGKRIAEAAGTCPICRGRLKKVKRILIV